MWLSDISCVNLNWCISCMVKEVITCHLDGCLCMGYDSNINFLIVFKLKLEILMYIDFVCNILGSL